MSVEILNNGPLFELPDGITMKDWYHDAIHDIELLFWVKRIFAWFAKARGRTCYARSY